MKTLSKLNEAHKLDSSSAPFKASEIQLICFALKTIAPFSRYPQNQSPSILMKMNLDVHKSMDNP